MMKLSKNIFNFSIASKILFSAGGVMILCLSIIIGLNVVSMNDALFRAYKDNFRAAAAYVSHAVSREIQSVSSRVETLADISRILNIDPESEVFSTMVLGLLQEDVYVNEIFYMRDATNNSMNGDEGLSHKEYVITHWERDHDDRSVLFSPRSVRTTVDEDTSDLYEGVNSQYEHGLSQAVSVGDPILLDADTLIITQMVPLIYAGKIHGVIGSKSRADFNVHMKKGLQMYPSAEYLLKSDQGLIVFRSSGDKVEGSYYHGEHPEDVERTFVDTWEETHWNEYDIITNNYLYIPEEIPSSSWKLAVRIAYDVLMAPIDITLMKSAFFAGLGIILVCIVLIWVVRSIIKPMEKAVKTVRVIASGDLTENVVVTSHDETGELLESIGDMNTNLNSLVGRMKISSMLLTTTIDKLNRAASIQRDSVQNFDTYTVKIVDGAGKISHTSQALANTMEDVAGMAKDSAGLASKGRDSLGSVEVTMTQLRQSIAGISDKLEMLKRKTGNISNVAVAISKVSDRTNLLSLNASIEAEKAGDYGTGFAVVATEIRRLADQTIVATQDIEYMIKEVQDAIGSSVTGVTRFADDVRNGLKDIGDLGEQFTTVASSVEQLEPRFNEVNAGMRDQSESAFQISTFMKEFVPIANTVVTSLSEVDTVIEQLQGSAQDLEKETARFTLSESMCELGRHNLEEL